MSLLVLPCLDSPEMAESRRRELDIPGHIAAELGESAMRAAVSGTYVTGDGHEVVWRHLVQAACAGKRSISPEASLSHDRREGFAKTRVQVTNETTLGAARRLADGGMNPLALNFANGIEPGGAFLAGARAQ